MEHLEAAKDPVLQLDASHDPFNNPASSQFGIVGVTADASQAMQTAHVTQDADEEAPDTAHTPGESSGQRGSPSRRAGYARGTPAELRARRLREVKQKHAEERTTIVQAPRVSSPVLPDIELEPSDASDLTTKTWDDSKLDVLYHTQKHHGGELRDHRFAIQVLENKVALLLGSEPPHPQSLRRRRYQMDAESSLGSANDEAPAEDSRPTQGAGDDVEQRVVRDGSGTVGSIVPRLQKLEATLQSMSEAHGTP